ncbi:LPS-assembly protein LptD [Thiomicrorhabdus aquaedulcis]|uniref:LPS-assembly protein LptD n=1 Tax=Thiomicrorhabdus aquaedulcis TaxID=2211106 RepID=UPI00156294C1|nr:LPS assembly protein LptD [Thiomicrorhabdus aquaedulcis]
MRLFTRFLLRLFMTLAALFLSPSLLMLAHAQPSALKVPALSTLEACLPDYILPLQTLPPQTPHIAKDKTLQTLEADRLEKTGAGQYHAFGDVILKQPGLVALGDELHYNQTQQTADLLGHVQLHQTQILIQGQDAHLNEVQQTGLINQARYQVLPSRVHGLAQTISIDQLKDYARLDSASVTACKIKPNQKVDWNLTFDTLEIDNQKRRMIGKHTTVYFKDLPVFYTPYFDFPLDDRASGLLFPEFGSYKSFTEEETQHFIKLPYYFNIAPNLDDTLTLIPMSDRGLALDNEFRYLAKNQGVVHGAELDITLLQDQETAQNGLASANRTTGDITFGKKIEDRWRASLKAQQAWGSGVSSDILWHEVSDENFFADIPVESTYKNLTQTERHATVNYAQGNFNAYAQILSYLRLRDAPLNYEKRPEIAASYFKQIDNLNLSVLTQATEFVKPLASTAKPEALRAHLEPALEYRLSQPFGELKTTVVANQTQYQMKDNGFNPNNQQTLNRFVPQSAVKGGLIFERELNISDHTFIQTLEPEVQYLYVPYVNQSQLTLFDTARRSLDFSNLFALNRFTGVDRIGDTNQLSMALTTQFLQETGKPLAEAGIGQIVYFDDRKVTLTNTAPQTEAVSDIFVKLGLTLDQFNFASTTQFDQATHELTNATNRLKWQPSERNLFLVSHTLTNSELPTEQSVLALGAYSQLTQQWETGLYADYDIDTQRINETNLGLRYDSCCWATELVAQRAELENGLYNYTVMVLFELKGLSTSGTPFRDDLTKRLNF